MQHPFTGNSNSEPVQQSADVKPIGNLIPQSDTEPLTFVVEDDKANNFLCQMTLEEVGITNLRMFFRADTTIEALKLMAENKEEFPSLILLDINMPAMDGWQFLNEFRNFPEPVRNKTTIYLFSTSDHPNDIAKKQMYPEVIDFLTKPLSEEVANSLKEKYFRPRTAG